MKRATGRSLGLAAMLDTPDGYPPELAPALTIQAELVFPNKFRRIDVFAVAVDLKMDVWTG